MDLRTSDDLVPTFNEPGEWEHCQDMTPPDYSGRRETPSGAELWARRGRAFGISDSDFSSAWRGQGGKCAICFWRPERPMQVRADFVGPSFAIVCTGCASGIATVRRDSSFKPPFWREITTYLERAA